MESFCCAAEEIRKQTGRIKNRMLGEIGEGNPVIFGAGECGHKIYNLMHGYGVDIQCFCDNGMAGNLDEATGLSIISPAELHDLIENPTILVCVGDENVCQAICQQLLSLGYDRAQIHMMHEYFYWQTGEYFEANAEKYKKVGRNGIVNRLFYLLLYIIQENLCSKASCKTLEQFTPFLSAKAASQAGKDTFLRTERLSVLAR